MYVVTANGYIGIYGVQFYIVGVYTSYDNALLAAERCPAPCKITEIELNATSMLSKDEYGDYANDKYIGGYAE